MSRRGRNPAPNDKVLSKVNWVKGNADDQGLMKDLAKDKDAFVHAIGLLLDSESGLRFANLITSGSQSVPSASATYDSEMRATAFNLLEAAESTKTSKPRPFVYVSAAEAGWEDNALGTKIEAGMKDKGFFLPRYLEAKRKVERKMSEDAEKAGIRPIVARPSFMWDPTKFDILPLLPVWTIGNKLNIGKGTFNPPLRVSIAGSAIVQAISDSSITGVVTSSQLFSLAPLSSKKSPDELSTFTSGIVSLSRLPYGTTVAPPLSSESGLPTPPRPSPGSLQIYQFEGCPYCRRVREACTALDLAYTVVPTGRGSSHRRQVENAAALMGRRATYPFMEDLDRGVQMFESGDIVEYLLKEYGGEAGEGDLPPPPGLAGLVPSIARGGRGSSVVGSARSSPPPPKALVLYDYDGNQFSRLVREALVELDLVHEIRSAGKGSRRREELEEVSGMTQVPFLLDPNTGVNMGESKDIVEYLFRTYENGYVGGKGQGVEGEVEERAAAMELVVNSI